jgi:hypothetical protein
VALGAGGTLGSSRAPGRVARVQGRGRWAGGAGQPGQAEQGHRAGQQGTGGHDRGIPSPLPTIAAAQPGRWAGLRAASPNPVWVGGRSGAGSRAGRQPKKGYPAPCSGPAAPTPQSLPLRLGLLPGPGPAPLGLAGGAGPIPLLSVGLFLFQAPSTRNFVSPDVSPKQ